MVRAPRAGPALRGHLNTAAAGAATVGVLSRRATHTPRPPPGAAPRARARPRHTARGRAAPLLSPRPHTRSGHTHTHIALAADTHTTQRGAQPPRAPAPVVRPPRRVARVPTAAPLRGASAAAARCLRGCAARSPRVSCAHTHILNQHTQHLRSRDTPPLPLQPTTHPSPRGVVPAPGAHNTQAPLLTTRRPLPGLSPRGHPARRHTHTKHRCPAARPPPGRRAPPPRHPRLLAR